MIYKMGLNQKITETVHKFLRTVTRFNKLGISDNIFIFGRDDIFGTLPNEAVFAYSRRLIEDV